MAGRFLLVIILDLSIMSLELHLCSSSTTTRCRDTERKALVQFKESLHDPTGRLDSWVGKDCCAWEAIGCSRTTGYVIKLNLRNPNASYDLYIEYPYWVDPPKRAPSIHISPSLVSLKHLRYLDLSFNNFKGTHIPKFLGSFKRLRYLDLSATGFIGRVPDELGNLSNLHHLDLSENYLRQGPGYPQGSLYIDDPGWLSQLTSLSYLDMDFVSFRNGSNWLQALNALPFVQDIHLAGCELGTAPSPTHVNFTYLNTLDLELNGIRSAIPNWLLNITSLTYLNLGFNSFYGLVPAAIGKMTSLETLDLSGNMLHKGFLPRALSDLCKLQTLNLYSTPIKDMLASLESVFSGCPMSSLENLDLSSTQLSGSLPDWLGNIKNLKFLDLSQNSLYGPLPSSLGHLRSLQYLSVSYNQLNGTIPQGIGQLRSLISLHLSHNSLRGTLSEVHFTNLTSLKELVISGNSLALKVSHDWVPCFQLKSIIMASCQIGPHFPKWLHTQQTVSRLDLRNTRIKGTIPDWFQNFAFSLDSLYLSDNEISGEVTQVFPTLTTLDLSNNSFSGHIPRRIGEMMPYLRYLDLFGNNLNGSIPLSFCGIKPLRALRLSKNNLSGEPPNCWKHSSKLLILDFSWNNLRGPISDSICSSSSLWSLHLSHNNLSRQIPLSLRSCTRLVTLDLSHNKFTGNIPTWIGESLLDLKPLKLSSNSFTGSIPQLSQLASLQILDLSGNIPRSFGNLSAMKGSLQVDHYLPFDYYGVGIMDDMWLFMKGKELQYSSILPFVSFIDLSGNNLSGHIPEELGSLHGLQSLNLSRNHLAGKMPINISGLQLLEVLDLSSNKLSGPIPSSLAALNYLSHLNLSYNNFSGRIPTGNQLQTLTDPSIYEGNPYLCGPLTKICPDEDTPSAKDNGGEKNGDTETQTEKIWLYTSTILGFAVGFWAICGTLLLQRRWSVAYFQAVDNIYDILYLMMMVNMTRFKRLLLVQGQIE